MPVFAGGACAGVFNGQRVGFSCEGGEGGRHLRQAGPDVGRHGVWPPTSWCRPSVTWPGAYCGEPLGRGELVNIELAAAGQIRLAVVRWIRQLTGS
jgi:hypothetical protein